MGPKGLSFRAGLVAAILLISFVPFTGGSASGASKVEDLQARLDQIQGELDAATTKVEAANAMKETLETRRDQLAKELETLKKKMAKLEKEVAVRAAALYKSGSTGVLDVLLNSEDFAALSDNAEILSQANVDDAGAFIAMARAKDRARQVSAELRAKNAELQKTEELLKDQASELQAKFNAVAAEYEALKKELAASQPATASAAAPTTQIKPSGDMVCPVGGPTSFVDSWGAPRSGGRSHQGVDLMAAYGTPQLAIVSGTITYAGYSTLGGNVQYLSGDDGNLYVYVHQSENTVTGGRVQAGQVISYLGDTGNAAGNPQLHFEYHPGGGAAVNPYPLVASLC